MKTIYDKYRNGDSITDAELAQAIPFFRRMTDDLMKLGETFRLAAYEANRMYIALDAMQCARRRQRP